MRGRIIISRGYDANSGFYTDEGEWVDFPEEVVSKLRAVTIMRVSWKARLRFLFTNKLDF